MIVIEEDKGACKVGWGPVCLDNSPGSGYRVGHMCNRRKGHAGRHVCTCRSWKEGKGSGAA